MELLLVLVAIAAIALLGATAEIFGVDSATSREGGEQHAWL
jgi:hypothetical protein